MCRMDLFFKGFHFFRQQLKKVVLLLYDGL